jgi:hypothetical protein
MPPVGLSAVPSMNMHLSGCPRIEVNRPLLLRRGNTGK